LDTNNPYFLSLLFFGPKDLPPDIVTKIDNAVGKVAENPKFRERIIKSLGFEVIHEILKVSKER